MTTRARQRFGALLGIAMMVATAIASGGGARAADNGAAASQSQVSDKSADATKHGAQPKAGPAPAPSQPAPSKPVPGPKTEARRGRGHF